MRLLLLTQKIDKNDDVLGFMHSWLAELAKHFEFIIAVSLEKGEHELPQNVSVFSLGKEKKKSRLLYIFNFYKIIWRERKNYDAVFVHMNPEYVLLGGIFWRMMGKKVIFWYNHTQGDWRADLAIKIAHIVCHTSPFAYTAGKKKSRRMPAGIDTSHFKQMLNKSSIPSILYIGRIAPVKDLLTLVRASRMLSEEGIRFSLDIYGSSLPKDWGYETDIKNEAGELIKKGVINFKGSVPYKNTPPIFSESWVFVNLTPSGNYDKTVIEAMAAGTIPLVSSKAFSDLLPSSLVFKEKDPHDLAYRLKQVIEMPQEQRALLGREMRESALGNHSLKKLAEKLSQVFCDY